MPEIDLRGVPSTVNLAFLPLFTAKESLVVLVGGANSSKSYSTAQKVAYKLISEPGHRFLLCRKVKKDVKYSVYAAVKSVIISWGLDDLFKYNETEYSIKCLSTGSDAICVGLDDVDKLKSLVDPTEFWLDEADQATEADVNQLRLRLRGNVTFPLQGTLSMNPISASHWIKKKYFDNHPEGVLTHRSTYRDNLRVNPQVVKYMKSIEDPYWRDVYVEGRWGVMGGAVFTNVIVEEFPYDHNSLEDLKNGMDFGYSHAQTIVRCGFLDGELYCYDELFAKGMVNSQFMDAARNQFGADMFYWKIKADSANPDKIEEWCAAGYDVEGAKKGASSIQFGIEYLTSLRIHIHATKCPNLAREMEAYHRLKDKDGNFLDKFINVNDDCIAALRYAVEDMGPRAGVAEGFTASDLGF